jgi:hypothetical protein
MTLKTLCGAPVRDRTRTLEGIRAALAEVDGFEQDGTKPGCLGS